MKKILKNWGIAILSVLFVFCAAFALMPAKTQVAEAAVLNELTFDQIKGGTASSNWSFSTISASGDNIVGSSENEIVYTFPTGKTVNYVECYITTIEAANLIVRRDPGTSGNLVGSMTNKTDFAFKAGVSGATQNIRFILTTDYATSITITSLTIRVYEEELLEETIVADLDSSANYTMNPAMSKNLNVDSKYWKANNDSNPVRELTFTYNNPTKATITKISVPRIYHMSKPETYTSFQMSLEVYDGDTKLSGKGGALTMTGAYWGYYTTDDNVVVDGLNIQGNSLTLKFITTNSQETQFGIESSNGTTDYSVKVYGIPSDTTIIRNCRKRRRYANSDNANKNRLHIQRLFLGKGRHRHQILQCGRHKRNQLGQL